MARVFQDTEAKRAQVPLLVGLVGPSGSGKTYSALRLATGIQRVTGGDIFVVDTEAKRALHYADKFRFRHLEFGAPFGPLDYLAAIEHCAKKGAKVIVVDSTSHEHEGPGGVLEMHEAEMQRMSRGNPDKAEKVKMLAWQRPKSERRRLLNTILQMPVSMVFCFRAKEKLKIIPGREPERQGWMPIAGEEFVFEMTANILLPPGSDGVPEWKPAEVGSRSIVKLPAQFRQLFSQAAPLSEEIGEAMARWAAGGEVGGGAQAPANPAPATPVNTPPEAPTLTAEQRKALVARVTSAMGPEAFVAWLKAAHGVARTADIPQSLLPAIDSYLDEWAPPLPDDDDLSMFDDEPGARG